MSAGRGDTRRRLLGSAAAWAFLFGCRGPAAGEEPRDRGIGGTGVVPSGPPDAPPRPSGDDRGIGGTGVVGTIRRFGSIYVNGLRIAYARDVAIGIDGTPATVAALRVGQVVRVLARQRGGALTTDRIEVQREVVGPVSSRTAGSLVVLGQNVSLAGIGNPERWKVGDPVAVSGLRRPDGTIAASLIEAGDAGTGRVAGPVVRGADGRTRIGGLPIDGLDPGLVGARTVVVGRPAGEGLESVAAARDLPPHGPGVRLVSIEAYVERAGRGVRLGSGLAVSGRSGNVPAGAARRAVLTARVGGGGELTVERVRTDRGVPSQPDGRERPGGAGPERPADVPRRSGDRLEPGRGTGPEGSRDAQGGRATTTRPGNIDLRDAPDRLGGSSGATGGSSGHGSFGRPDGPGLPGFGDRPGPGGGFPGGGPGGFGPPGGRR